METIKAMNLRRLVALTGALLAASAPAVRADSDSDTFPVPFVVRGFQANSSSPFVVTIDGIVTGVWQRLLGPVPSTTLGTIPSAVGFGGGGCQLEYSQDRIVTQDGSTLTFDVYGLRCVPAASPGAHVTTGSYSIVGGTGRFGNGPGGVGTVSIDSRADGSAFISISGMCQGGACGSIKRP
ncbi:exported hypothetical protein [Candidatus Sulfopaludibacter sp. SbA4]|nr:exported hypothetical protein [Candidatus Sulfopaludibacter sp. SbA4]